MNIDAVIHAAEPKHQVERLHRCQLPRHPLRPATFPDGPQVPVVMRFRSDMPPQEVAVGATIPNPTIMISPTTTIRHEIGVQRPHIDEGQMNLHARIQMATCTSLAAVVSFLYAEYRYQHDRWGGVEHLRIAATIIGPPCVRAAEPHDDWCGGVLIGIGALRDYKHLTCGRPRPHGKGSFAPRRILYFEFKLTGVKIYSRR